MRSVLQRLYHESPLGRRLLTPAKQLEDLVYYRLLPAPLLLRLSFKRFLGYDLDLANPRTLNEKIQWLKLHDRTDLHVRCADKLAVREHVAQTLGRDHLVPLLQTLDTADALTPGTLPPAPFIIKTNHNSGGATVIRDKAKVDWPTVRHHFARLLATNYYYRVKEWQYKDIQPRILIEELLLDAEGHLPLDYKFHCCNGRVAFIQVDIDRHVEHRRNLYDRQWQRLDCGWKYPQGREVPAPPRLAEMITLAETLAAAFLYVRVDFYNLGSDVRFGELTFHPESGFGRFEPARWDRAFGDMLDLAPGAPADVAGVPARDDHSAGR
jgi:hypothetical protein